MSDVATLVVVAAVTTTPAAGHRNPLWDVFFAGHALIAAIRKLLNVEKAS